MLDTAYLIAAVLALAGGLCGNRVAWPLLGSFAFCQVARWQEWPFDRNLWATIDLVVLICIGFVLCWRAVTRPGPAITQSDAAVVLLFAPGLASYGLDPPARYYLSMAVGIAQLLLVFRPHEAWLLLTRAAKDLTSKDDFDLMVAAR